MASRKRPAPGTSPARQQLPTAQTSYQYPQNGASFGNAYGGQLNNDAGIPFPSNPFDSSLYSVDLNPAHPQTYPSNTGLQPAASNQLVRRNTNQQVAARQPGLSDQWNVANTSEERERSSEEMKKDEHNLDQRAAAAKKDAQAKRKQIPPFVLKLWR